MKKLITAIILITTILFTPLSFANDAGAMTDRLDKSDVSYIWQSLARTLTVFGVFLDVDENYEGDFTCFLLNSTYPEARVNRIVIRSKPDGFKILREESCQ